LVATTATRADDASGDLVVAVLVALMEAFCVAPGVEAETLPAVPLATDVTGLRGVTLGPALSERGSSAGVRAVEVRAEAESARVLSTAPPVVADAFVERDADALVDGVGCRYDGSVVRTARADGVMLSAVISGEESSLRLATTKRATSTTPTPSIPPASSRDRRGE